MEIVDTYTVNIYVGLHNTFKDITYNIFAAQHICKEFCNDVGGCVTVTPTTYVYTNGWEDGVIVGFINYPRFPADQDKILDKAFELAERLKTGLEQKRVSIVTPTKTYMIGNKDD